MVKQEVFDWIRSGQKSIELRKRRAKLGDNAVFQCGRKFLKGSIVKKEEGSLMDVMRADNYRKIIPSAHRIDEAIAYVTTLYGSSDGTFTAYYFELWPG